MALKFFYHPLSSFCWKALVGLYEKNAEFEPVIVNLGDPASRDAFLAVWPLGKFPVIQNTEAGEVFPESSIILEYLDQQFAEPPLIPADAKAALNARKLDRIIDLHLHVYMQKVVGDRLRGAGEKDPVGVAEARAKIRSAYAWLERELQGRTWLTGEDFGLVECAALPALFYGDKVEPIGEDLPLIRAYLERLKARPSAERVLTEAEPYFQYFPAE